jgi:hypothetical protein
MPYRHIVEPDRTRRVARVLDRAITDPEAKGSVAHGIDGTARPSAASHAKHVRRPVRLVCGRGGEDRCFGAIVGRGGMVGPWTGLEHEG